MINPYRFSSIFHLKRPEHLIYIKNQKYRHGIDETGFLLFSIKNPSERAIMYCYPEDVYRKDVGWVKSLYISYLDAMGNQDKGLGTMLLKAASNFSKMLGFDGRLHLDSSGLQTPERVPHIFYRKFGMNTGIERIDKKLDEFIKNEKSATTSDFESMTMFFPPIKYSHKEKLSLLQSIKQHILSCLNWRKY